MSDLAVARPSRVLSIYLAFTQFALLACWTVYAIYLPSLLAGAGLDRSLAPWILLADQVVFAAFDIAAGFAADRAFRAYARLGPWILGATVVSGGAFLLLPWISGSAGHGGHAGQLAPWLGVALLGLTMVWVVTSAALRAPVFGLLSRHAAPGDTPRLAGLVLVGMALAAAIAPYLGMFLKGIDPRWPFALSSLAIVATAAGLVVAEKRLLPVAPEPENAATSISPVAFLVALLVAALAIQVAVNLNASPRYLRDFGASALPFVLPVFWVGFSASAFTVGAACKRFGAASVFSAGCAAGVAGLFVASLPGAVAALSGYLVAGLGWGAALSAAFGLAGDAGRPHRVATMTGLLFAVLAAASFARIGTGLAGWPQRPDLAGLLAAFPIIGLLAAGLAVYFGTRLHRNSVNDVKR